MPRACAPRKKGISKARRKPLKKLPRPIHPIAQYALDWQIARQHGITKLIQDADKARILGHPEVARAKLTEAMTLDPLNVEVSQHLNDLANLSLAPPPADTVSVTFAPAIELTPKGRPAKLSFPEHRTGSAAPGADRLWTKHDRR